MLRANFKAQIHPSKIKSTLATRGELAYDGLKK
jgi:hypothetical protein